MNRMPGDWNCMSCQHFNFNRRETCQLCGYPKSIGGDPPNYAIFGGVGGGSSFNFTNPDVKPGDWYCQCGYHNFASRFNCLRCNASKNESVVSINGSCAGRSWKTGDWLCTGSGCNWHNFASRMECYKCNAPRSSGTEV